MARQPKPQPRHVPEPGAHFTRNRVVVLAVSMLAMLIAAVLVWLAMGSLSNVTDSSPTFPIKQVTFVGEMQRVDSAELARVAGGIRGSMMRTNLSDVKAVFKQVHWVRNADVRRRFPATLEVSVEEHRPFARWKDGESERGLLVNTFGEVFEAPLDAPLPMFSGPDGTAREVLANYEKFVAQLAVISQTPTVVTLSARRAWELKLDNGASLELGRTEVSERLDRYVKAYAAIPALQLANAQIDLRYQSGMALKVIDAKPSKPVTGTATKPAKKATVKL